MESSANGGTFYIFDGGLLLGEVNSAGTVEAAYTWGAAGLVSERLVPSGTSLWYGFGPQGETRLLTNSNGSIVDSYVYSAYGQPIAASGTDANPFRFGGMFGYYTDAADAGGAVLQGLRWYDPNNGRWLSRDRIGYSGGSDLYGYCYCDPVNEFDTDGCEVAPITIIRGGITAAGATEAIGLGPEDPVADAGAATEILGSILIAGGVAIVESIGGSDYNGPLANGPTQYTPYPGYAPNRELPVKPPGSSGSGRPVRERDPAGNPIDGAHTQLGKNGWGDPVAREWPQRVPGKRDVPIRDRDNTDHGDPDHHPDVPHEHPYDPKTGQRYPGRSCQ